MMLMPLFLFFLAAQPASSQRAPAPAAKAPALLLGRDLVQRCTAWSAGPDYCYGYVAAVYDTARAYEAWLNTHELCVPDGTSQSELVKAVMDHLRANPSELDGQAASVVVVALQNRYACTAATPRSQ